MRLGHRTAGDPDGVPVILLHGLGSSAATWDRFATDLAAGRQAIALDLRGHGTSPHASEYSFDLMADDVLAFLADRGLTRIDLVGHSMGGMVALHLTERTLVRRLVIEDMAPAEADGPPPDPVDFPDQPPQPVPFDRAVMAPSFDDARRRDPARWEALRRITAPTMWISGGPTSHIEPARIEAAAAATSSVVTTIPVGHHIHREAPEEFAAAVLPHLSSVADATA